MTLIGTPKSDPSHTLRLSMAAALAMHYFGLPEHEAWNYILDWADEYPAPWVQLAVIEALYQGRYKPVSVLQILLIWQRRSKPLCHFSREFESIITVPLQHLPRAPYPPPIASPRDRLPRRTLTTTLKSLWATHLDSPSPPTPIQPPRSAPAQAPWPNPARPTQPRSVEPTLNPIDPRAQTQPQVSETLPSSELPVDQAAVTTLESPTRPNTNTSDAPTPGTATLDAETSQPEVSPDPASSPPTLGAEPAESPIPVPGMIPPTLATAVPSPAVDPTDRSNSALFQSPTTPVVDPQNPNTPALEQPDLTNRDSTDPEPHLDFPISPMTIAPSSLPTQNDMPILVSPPEQRTEAKPRKGNLQDLRTPDRMEAQNSGSVSLKREVSPSDVTEPAATASSTSSPTPATHGLTSDLTAPGLVASDLTTPNLTASDPVAPNLDAPGLTASNLTASKGAEPIEPEVTPPDLRIPPLTVSAAPQDSPPSPATESPDGTPLPAPESPDFAPEQVHTDRSRQDLTVSPYPFIYPQPPRRSGVSQLPIHKFSPLQDTSGFAQKLKAVALASHS
ncbi:MAG: hypothetical protein ACO4AI_06130 [Prochlorothrix sp.]